MIRNIVLAGVLVAGVIFASLHGSSDAATGASKSASDNCATLPCCADEGSPGTDLVSFTTPNSPAALNDDESPSKDDEKKDEGKKKKKEYPEPDPKMGHIAGTVRLKGAPPKLAEFVVDPGNRDIAACKAHAKDERLIVGKDGVLKNVVITLHDYKAARRPKPRDVVVDNKGCLFTPHVVASTIGSKLTLTNSDPMLHNSRGVLDMNFNVAIPPGGKIEQRTPRKEGFCMVLCDFHPWMQSRYHFFAHDHFDVTDETGTYKLVNIPPGTYTVEIRHEVLASKFTPVLKKDIVVKEGETTPLEIELEAPKN